MYKYVETNVFLAMSIKLDRDPCIFKSPSRVQGSGECTDQVTLCVLLYSNITVQLYNLIILEGFIPLLIDGSDDDKRKFFVVSSLLKNTK